MSRFDRDNARVDVGMAILEQACEKILDVVYRDAPGAIPGDGGHQYDVLAMLLAVYCRRAQAIGDDPQQMLKEFWPPNAIWVEEPGRR